MNKKEKEEFKLKMLKESIKHKEKLYDSYIETLIEYSFPLQCKARLGYKEMWRNIFLNTHDKIEKSKSSKKKKLELNNFLLLGGYSEKRTEMEILKEEEEYNDKLIKHVECTLKNLDDNIKKEIVKDRFRQEQLLFAMWDKEYSIKEKLNKKVKKK